MIADTLVFWEGPDGSSWNLRRGAGPRLTEDGFTGLIGATFEDRTRQLRRGGQQRTGGRALANTMFLKCVLFTDPHADADASEFRSLYRAFAGSFSRTQYGRVVVVSGDRVVTREARLVRGPSSPKLDPAAQRELVGVWELIADDPWWYLPTWSRTFESAARPARSYYGGGAPGTSSQGYPLVRGAGRQAGRVLVDNPGSEPATWVARFQGPVSAFSFSVDGAVTAGALPAAVGEYIEVDSSRRSVALIRRGEREPQPWHRLDSMQFKPIQPGQGSDVRITSIGDGVPELTFRPRLEEAL